MQNTGPETVLPISLAAVIRSLRLPVRTCVIRLPAAVSTSRPLHLTVRVIHVFLLIKLTIIQFKISYLSVPAQCTGLYEFKTRLILYL